MVRAIKVCLSDAEKVRLFLRENKLYNITFQVKKEGDFIYFPVVRGFDELVDLPDGVIIKSRVNRKSGKVITSKTITGKNKRLKTSKNVKIKKSSMTEEKKTTKMQNEKIEFPVKNVKVVDIVLPPKDEKTPGVLMDLLNGLSSDEKKLLPRSFDVIGDILVLELDDGLHKKEKMIAEAYLQAFRGVRTVVKKAGAHSGLYRRRLVTVLAGEKRKETIHRESGVQLKVDIERVYFSPRLGAERLRIARQVKKGEDVLVMFSGCAPYCCVIARQSLVRRVYGVEINPEGHRYGLENIRLNKVEDRVKLFCGDVRKVVPTLRKKFDRIVMPLPKTGKSFLALALKYIKPHGMIHYYGFFDEDKIESKGFDEIEKICLKEKRKCRIVSCKKVGQHAPRVWRVCFDVLVGK